MFGILGKKLKEKKGFTLMEMMLVVAITAILGGLVTAGIYGYMTTAYMTRANDTAKTVFFASQNYITEQKQLGKLEEFNRTAESYGEALSPEELKEIFLAGDSSFDFAAYQEKYGTSTVRYLKLDAGEGNTESTNPIYTVVKNYLNDTDLLEHTFLVEYDTRTGVVRSVFYTEKADRFTYEGDRQGKDNVVLRDTDTLRKKRQGYYGVDSTSLARTDIELYAPKNVVLMNGERLYLRWQESNFLSPEEIRSGHMVNANEAFDNVALRSFLVYDVAVCRTTAEGEELLFTVSGLKPGMAQGRTLAEADAYTGVPADGVVRMTYDSDTNVYQLILDDIDHSIYTLASSAESDSRVAVTQEVKASDMLYCRVSVRLDGHDEYTGESDGVSSNVQSANFAGGKDTYSPTMLEADTIDVYGNGNLTEDGSGEEYGKAFSIANARHLNNMRYAAADACFRQTADIDWSRPEADRSEAAEDFEPLTFQKPEPLRSGVFGLRAAGDGLLAARVGEERVEEFAGTFINGREESDDYVISNLTIDKLTGTSPEKRVGMFRQNGGTIRKLHLKGAGVRGASLTGAVAGVNRGSLEEIYLEDCRVEAVYYGGGVTGYNYAPGSIRKARADVSIHAVLTPDTGIAKEAADEAAVPDYGWYFGGLAGVNQGTVAESETLPGAAGKNTVSGTACVGGLVGANRSASGGIRRGVVTESVNRNTVETAKEGADPVTGVLYQDFGGVAGANEKDSRIEECRTETLAFLERDAARPDYICNIGGIAGRNAGRLVSCSNEENSSQGISVAAFTAECVSSAENGKLPVFSGENVGGIVGWNEEDGAVENCGSGNLVAGYRNVGGIAGRNAGTLSFGTGLTESGHILSQEERSVRGIVLATRESAGGIAGTNETKKLSGYQNRANVFAGSLAGGIVGANGGTGAFRFGTVKGDAGYYTELFAPSFENVDSTAEISKCENLGFVYALERYAGGITGLNLGRITACGSTVELSENASLKTLLDENTLYRMARADCVGGIAGANLGSIQGDSLAFSTIRAGICGCDFVGGVAGLNTGIVKNIQKVQGDLWAKGNGIGGILGVNRNTESLNQIALADGMHIQGGYFVGGVIGLNVASGRETARLKGLVTQAQERQGSVRGTAYVGGILGYNTALPDGWDYSRLFAQELEPLIGRAFSAYVPGGGSTSVGGSGAAVFEDCINRFHVYADRYLGGIVGYNGESSPLYVTDSINYGTVAVTEEGKGRTTDGYYFIGGITGRNSAGGVIHACINDGSVESPSKYLGGICEVNEGYVQFCTVGKDENYKDRGITGENSVGGLVGLNSCYVVQCTTSQYARVRGGDNTGGIAGTNDPNGIITGDASKARNIAGITDGIPAGQKCTSAGTVIGKDHTGGIAGLNQGQIELVEVGGTATISGEIYVGGFIGSNEGTISQEAGVADGKVIRDLDNRARLVIGLDEVGGIVGSHNADRIRNCRNYGSVQLLTGASGNVGGITGSVAEKVTIEECQNYGEVTGNATGSHAGGITGINEKGGSIKNCQNYGMAVSTEAQGGGIAGNNSGKLSDCENLGSVQGALVAGDDVAIGGIAGVNTADGTIQNCASKKSFGDNILGSQIMGASTVGGIIGYNQGILDNTTKESLLVTASIRTPDQKVSRPSSDSYCRIGGVIGRDRSKSGWTLKDFVYDGTIEVTQKGASNAQRIGGMIGETENDRLTLENCRLTGKIKGVGNAKNANSGVGGLTGVSRSRIIVYPDKNGVYTANSEDALVEGCVNVGGLTGVVEKGHALYLKRDASAEAVRLEKVPENNDADPDNDLFYTNLATVSGTTRVGGCYGFLRDYRKADEADARAEFHHYQNGFQRGDGSRNGGQIRPNLDSGMTCQSIGGIIGSDSGIHVDIHFSDLYNYGTIGSESMSDYPDAYSQESIGGIIGYCSGQRNVELERLYNYGRISCGKRYVGGLAGRVEAWSGRDNIKLHDSINYGLMETKAAYSGGLVGSAYQMLLYDVENRGEIRAYQGAGQIGGILGGVGGSTPSVRIERAVNGAPVSTNWTTLLENTAVGGIAGYVNGTAEIVSCENQGEMMLMNAGRCGGILGYASGMNSTTDRIVVTDCINKGSLKMCAERAGGIAGMIYATTGNRSGLVFENNSNEGEIGAKYRSGGLIGMLYAPAGGTSGWTIRDCTNRGNLYPLLCGTTLNQRMHEHGGCIGFMQTCATVTNFVNEGDLVIDVSRTDRALSEISDLGGVAGMVEGVSNNRQASLYQCENKGSIQVANLGSLNNNGLYNVGGVVGRMSSNANPSLVKSCTNKKEIDFSGFSASVVSNVGGVAGNVGKNGKLLYCCNQESVLTKNGGQIGGVAGINSGLIYACRTERAGGTGKQVTGEKAVGGIVGLADGITAKLGSLKNESGDRVELIVNTFDVSGVQKVGGIVGNQRAATIVGAVNGEVTIRLLGSSDGNNYCAGGIVGLAEGQGGLQGVIANCYNFGEVCFDTDTRARKRYLGGIIGFRSGISDGRKGASIKDAFYLGDGYSLVDESRPLDAFDSQILAVGNEPLGDGATEAGQKQNAKIQDAEDQMFGILQEEKLQETERFFWSEEAYRKMYGQVRGSAPSDSSDWDDMDTVMDEIMRHYDLYKLPIPETDQVTAGEVYDYLLNITRMPGFCEELKLYLYDGEKSVAEIEAAANADTPGSTPAPLLGPVTQEVTMDGQLENIPFQPSELQDYIGKPLKVALQATGVKDELQDGSEVVYTADSDVRVVEEFILMPPLVTPQIEMVSQDEVTRMTFRITNWEEYQKSAGEIYESIANNPSVQNQAIYQKLVNGLLCFEIQDYYQTSQSGTTGGGVSETHKISPADIASDGTFTIDYADSALFGANRSARQWHYWQTKAVAAHSVTNGEGDAAYWSVDRTDVETGNLYRYTTSKPGTNRFQIKDKVPLDPPTDLEAEYLGGLDADGAPNVERTEEGSSGSSGSGGSGSGSSGSGSSGSGEGSGDDADDPVDRTPCYELRFTESASPREAIAYYRITVENPDNGRTYTLEYMPEDDGSGDGSGSGGGSGSGDGPAERRTGKVLLDKETLLGTGENQLALDLSPGHSAPIKLKYTVQAVCNDSEAAKYYLDSEEVSTEIPMLEKGYPVDEPLTITVESPDDDAKKYIWKYEWTDERYENGDQYLVSWRVWSGDTIVATSDREEETDQKFFVWDTSQWQTEGNILELFVRRKGQEENGSVIRLHSDPVVLQKELGRKLADVTDVETKFLRLESSGEGDRLVYEVNFTIPPEITEENCKGFSIVQIGVEGTGIQLGDPVELTWEEAVLDALPVEVTIPLDGNRGKNFYTLVQAKAALPGDADSQGATSDVHKIPDEQLEPPEDIKVLVKTDGADGRPGYDYDLSDSSKKEDYSFLTSEYDDMEYELCWTTDSSAAIKAQHLELYAPDAGEEDEPLWSTDTAKAESSIKIRGGDMADIDWPSYAGKELLLKVYNLTADVEACLPSEAGSAVFCVPYERLAEPELEKEAVILAGDDEVGADDSISEADYDQLSCQVILRIPDETGQEEIKAVRIGAFTEPEQDGGDLQPLAFEMALGSGSSLAGSTDDGSAVEIEWSTVRDAAENDCVTFRLKKLMLPGGAAAGLAEKKITVSVSYVADAPDAGKTGWKDSRETQTSVQMPKISGAAGAMLLLLPEEFLPQETAPGLVEITDETAEEEIGENTEEEAGGESAGENPNQDSKEEGGGEGTDVGGQEAGKENDTGSDSGKEEAADQNEKEEEKKEDNS